MTIQYGMIWRRLVIAAALACTAMNAPTIAYANAEYEEQLETIQRLIESYRFCEADTLCDQLLQIQQDELERTRIIVLKSMVKTNSGRREQAVELLEECKNSLTKMVSQEIGMDTKTVIRQIYNSLIELYMRAYNQDRVLELVDEEGRVLKYSDTEMQLYREYVKDALAYEESQQQDMNDIRNAIDSMVRSLETLDVSRIRSEYSTTSGQAMEIADFIPQFQEIKIEYWIVSIEICGERAVANCRMQFISTPEYKENREGNNRIVLERNNGEWKIETF